MGNKKELDMETMFQKIMPSAAAGSQNDPAPQVPLTAAVAPGYPFSNEDGQAAAQPAAAAAEKSSAQALDAPAATPSMSAPEVSATLASPLAETAPMAAPAAAPTPTAAALEELAIADAVQAIGALAQASSLEPRLVNLTRTFIESRLDSALTKFHCCTCEKCQMDILAVALNKARPEYQLLTPAEDALSQITPQLAQEAVTALVQSILQIKSHPRH